MEKTRLRNEIEKINRQIKQRKADNKKGCSNSDEESVAHPLYRNIERALTASEAFANYYETEFYP